MGSTYTPIDTSPILNKSIGLNYNVTMSPEEKVNYLVQNVRLVLNNFKNWAEYTKSTSLDNTWTPFAKDNYDVENEYFCDEGEALTELLIKMHSDKKDISFEKFYIANLNKLSKIQENDSLKKNLQKNQHCFSIVTIKDRKYIIDCTYRQFFQKIDNGIQQIIKLEDVMCSDEESRNIASHILQYG